MRPYNPGQMIANSRSASSIPLWRNVRVYRIAGQILFVLVILLIVLSLCSNLSRGLAKFSSTLSFDFLQSSASIPLSESPIPYDASDPYYFSFVVGVLNTLRVVVVGIVLASLLGLIGGISRLSTNWLVAKIAQVYVEIFRNTPLLIQLYFWYLAGVLKFPRIRESVELPGSIYLSNRGIVLPWFQAAPTFGTWLQISGAAVVAAIVLYYFLGRANRESPLREWRGLWVFLLFVAASTLSAQVLNPLHAVIPKIEGFNYVGGISLSGEYVALLFGLIMYTGAFITEIVRAGILAVPRGLNEASRALGLSYAQTLRLVTVPLALRVIIPPLTNQYLNLAKNSSLAVAIAYPDLFYVATTIFNQTGQTIQIVAMIMGTYLLMSLIIAFIMSQVNARFKLVER